MKRILAPSILAAVIVLFSTNSAQSEPTARKPVRQMPGTPRVVIQPTVYWSQPSRSYGYLPPVSTGLRSYLPPTSTSSVDLSVTDIEPPPPPPLDTSDPADSYGDPRGDGGRGQSQDGW